MTTFWIVLIAYAIAAALIVMAFGYGNDEDK
jgi:hypothetical protein